MSFTGNFNTDIEFIYNKLANRDHFAFSKYSDGEYSILRNSRITNCDGWTFDPIEHVIEHKYLLESFTYSDSSYYVGIGCPCCNSSEFVQWMRSNVKTANVTWANVFVNGNYEYFKTNIIPEFNNWNGEVNIVAHKSGMGKSLPFKIDSYLPIEIGSWLNPSLEHIIDLLKVKAKSSNNQLFLFSAGPLGNILAHQLHIVNKNNTYIDIGSTVNPWIVGNNRGYLRNNSNKVCIW